MRDRSVLNKLFLLKLLKLSNGIYGSTRMQKLVFDVESIMRANKFTTFNYLFIRWHYGPFSKELIEDLEFLMQKGYVNKSNESNFFTLTFEGKSLLQKAEQTYKELGIMETNIGRNVKSNSQLPLNTLLEDIYKKYSVQSYKMGDVIEPIR